MALYPDTAELRLLNTKGSIVAGFAATDAGGEIAMNGKFGEVHVNTRQAPPLVWVNTLGGQKWTAP